MRTKNLMVSFLAVIAVFALVATVAAYTFSDVSNVDVKVDGTYIMENGSVQDATLAFEAGDTIDVMVRFTADMYDSDVTVEATLEGQKVDVSAMSNEFDVEDGSTYKKTLSLKVPYELKDELSDELGLTIEIDGKNINERFHLKNNDDKLVLRVQRPSYNVAIKSVGVPQTIDAGETFPVEIVIKNIGYNDLDDLYVTAKIESLGVEKTGYFGDIVAMECGDNYDRNSPNNTDAEDTYGVPIDRKCNSDDSDSVSGKLYLEVPYGVEAGAYTLEVVVSNEDTTSTKAVQVVVDNDFSSTVYKAGNNLMIVNPTDKVVGYRIVAESPATVSESMVFVEAGKSTTVTVSPNAVGEYTFDVNVFTVSGDLVNTVTFSGNAVGGDNATNDTDNANPIVILTVILAIIFIVLLIVLIVLIGKKPEKSGEFGESYY